MFKDKIAKLRCYKVYSYDIFSDSDKHKAQSLISRASRDGLIVKFGKGKFYKRSKSESKLPIREFNNNPSNKSALRYDSIAPNRYRIFKHLFWSNRNIAISLDNYINRVLSEDLPSYIPYLSSFFGDRKVIEVYLNFINNGNDKLPLIERYLKI
ncbi:MAG: hypothetical protein U9N59_08345 [Campylobacterota bacterium]|nr:hypothetical protein [Campylobacterota bacterium]